MPNLGEALEFTLSEDGQAALAIVAALQLFWMCRGMLREAGQWTDHALACTAGADPRSAADRPDESVGKTWPECPRTGAQSQPKVSSPYFLAQGAQ